MSNYDEYEQRQRLKRDTTYLEPEEMTMAELKNEMASCLGSAALMARVADEQRFRAAQIKAFIDCRKGIRVLAGGGISKARKKKKRPLRLM
jgi:hypothetical protein